ncbi:MAG: gliding motility-associated C-terminal domain-containing protein [Saprospiraceae bacterium]|nr:gliding motility-associated C-terminal domain-containing protein [Saprospiraceae bacterium]
MQHNPVGNHIHRASAFNKTKIHGGLLIKPPLLNLRKRSGSNGNGVYSWSGEGIINSQQNLFLTHAGMTGRTVPVSILYQEGACAYRDTLLVQVNPVPTPDFVIGDAPCENIETTITYTGTASAQAVFSWDFGTGAVVNGTAGGPYQVSWPDEGTKTVSLQIEDSGCTSTLLEQTVSVTAPLVPPVISCEATYTEIVFTWQPTPGATSFEVNVLDGMPGILVTDTSYAIQNLQPGDPVTLEVVVENNGPCPPVATQLTCETDLCPAVSISIDPVLPICFDGSIPDTIDLSFSLSGNSPQGTLLWSGPGIFDPSVARVALAAGMIGQPNTILALYRESVCEYSASRDITVRAVPVAAFTADPLICNSDESTVAFTGSATGNAIFNWNFDGGQALPGNGSGPQQVSWQDAGQYSVSLWISDNACLSDTFSLNVQVDEPLLPPTLSCTPDYDNMTVSWTAVAGADNYDLQLPAGVTASALSDTSVSIQNLQPGTNLNYTLTALGSTICGSVSVTGSCATPLCPTRNLSWSTTPVICRGTAISIPIDLQGNSGNTWQIVLSDGTNTTTLNILNDTLLQFSPTATTTYTITAATDPLLPICNIGLPAALTVVVNTPVEAGTPLPAPEFCAGENGLIVLADLLQNEQTGGVWTELSGQPSTGGAFNAATGTFNIAGQLSGTYRFRYALTAIAPCVSDFAEVSVVIHPNPVADAGTDQALDCLTATASLGGPLTTITPGLNYQWQSNNGAVVEQPTQPLTETTQAGSFTLIVSNPATGCQDEDVVLVSNNTNSLGLNARAFDATCLNEFGSIVVDSVTGGDQPYLYSLNNAPFSAQQVFAALNPGDYHLVVQDATGCTSEMDFQIAAATSLEVELIAHLAEEPYTIDLGETADLTALVNIPEDQVQSVRWQPDTLGCAGCLEQTVQPFYSTAYTVTVTDVNGCTASDDILLYVRRERDVYIPNGFSPNGDGLNDVFMIFAGRQVRQIRSFLIFTRWGESIFQKNNFRPNDPAYGWDGIFRNQRMNSGVYVYFAEVEYIDGEVVIFKGDVALIE